MSRPFGVVLLTAFLLLAAVPSALAQINAPNARQRANLQLALDNLDAMINDARAALPANPTGAKARAEKAAAERELERLRAIHTNLAGKLRAGTLKSVPGLQQPPKKYRQGRNAPESPVAAYCDDQTYVKVGDNWVQCTEDDIIIDQDVLDPGGVAIDETNQAGWEKKYTLLHVISHEKMHELLIEEQVRLLTQTQAWPTKNAAQRAILIAEAKRRGATVRTHQTVYEWQKNVLRWKRRQLERQVERLKAAARPDQPVIDALKAKIDWLTATIAKLQEDMANATAGHQFNPWERCGWPRGVRDGVLKTYVAGDGIYWRLDGMLRNGRVSRPSIGEVFWMGELTPQTPIEAPPATMLVMKEEVFSGAHTQPEACAFLATRRADELTVVSDPARLEATLSQFTGYPVEAEGGVQALRPQARLDGREPIVVGRNNEVGSGARARSKAISTAAGVIGGLLGGGGGGSRGRSDDGPRLASCRARSRDMALAEDPAAGVALRAAAQRARGTITVIAEIARSPDSGSFQAAFLQSPDGEILAPSKAEICDLWGEWRLSVSWTRSTYVDGQLVDRQSGGWSERGLLSVPGLRSTSDRPDGLWRRMGFSNASHGARKIRLTFPAPAGPLEGPVDLVVHVTRPSRDPVITAPVVLTLREDAGGLMLSPP